MRLSKFQLSYNETSPSSLPFHNLATLHHELHFTLQHAQISAFIHSAHQVLPLAATHSHPHRQSHNSHPDPPYHHPNPSPLPRPPAHHPPLRPRASAARSRRPGDLLVGLRLRGLMPLETAKHAKRRVRIFAWRVTVEDIAYSASSNVCFSLSLAASWRQEEGVSEITDVPLPYPRNELISNYAPHVNEL